MTADLTTAIVSASATALVAIVAIINNNKRLDDTNSRLSRLESKLDHIEQMLATYGVCDMKMGVLPMERSARRF